MDLDEVLLSEFLDESTLLMDRLNADLLRFDEIVRLSECFGENPADLELLNSMFRSVHSIKGISAMMGLSNINQLTHRVENVFDAARKGELQVNSQVVETVFMGIDGLSSLLEQLRRGELEANIYPAIEAIEYVLKSNRCHREAATQADAERALARHAKGDWGELDRHDKNANNSAVANGARLRSAYTDSNGVKFWIVTEASRSSTTILLPEDY